MVIAINSATTKCLKVIMQCDASYYDISKFILWVPQHIIISTCVIICCINVPLGNCICLFQKILYVHISNGISSERDLVSMQSLYVRMYLYTYSMRTCTYTHTHTNTHTHTQHTHNTHMYKTHIAHTQNTHTHKTHTHTKYTHYDFSYDHVIAYE